MNSPEDEFLRKAISTYTDVLQSINAFEELVQNCCTTAFKPLLPNFKQAFQFSSDLRLKKYKGQDTEGAFIEVGLIAEKEYISMGLWLANDANVPRPDIYTAIYCPSKRFAETLAAKCTDDNFKAEPWEADWYLVSYKTLEISGIDSMSMALATCAKELCEIGKRFQEVRQS